MMDAAEAERERCAAECDAQASEDGARADLQNDPDFHSWRFGAEACAKRIRALPAPQQPPSGEAVEAWAVYRDGKMWRLTPHEYVARETSIGIVRRGHFVPEPLKETSDG